MTERERATPATVYHNGPMAYHTKPDGTLVVEFNGPGDHVVEYHVNADAGTVRVVADGKELDMGPEFASALISAATRATTPEEQARYWEVDE